MPFDPSVEPPIPLGQVNKLPWLPRRRRGRKIHTSTVFRWVQVGLRGIRLEAIRVGGTRCTSEAALRRFFERLSAADPLCGGPGPAVRSPVAAARGHRRAEAELKRAGV